MEQRNNFTKFTDILVVISVVVLLVIAGIIALIELSQIKESKSASVNSAYVYMYESPETGACYYITTGGYICPIYNSDGTIYTK